MAKLIHELVPIPGPEAIATAKALASKEGILTGISGGATMYAALETAKKAPKGSVIVAMLPDTGERYLSTPLFADIEVCRESNRECRRHRAACHSLLSHLLRATPPCASHLVLHTSIPPIPRPT